MEKIGNYYQSSLYEKTTQAAKDADRAKAGSARKAGGTEEGKKAPALSKAAQNLLTKSFLLAVVLKIRENKLGEHPGALFSRDRKSVV